MSFAAWSPIVNPINKNLFYYIIPNLCMHKLLHIVIIAMNIYQYNIYIYIIHGSQA